MATYIPTVLWLNNQLFWHISSGALLALSFALFIVYLRADRSRGRRRCPRCWYDMSATPGWQCPECGRTARTEKHLFRRKPRRRYAALALILAFLAYPAWHSQSIRRRGWVSIVPTLYMYFAGTMPSIGGSTLESELERRRLRDQIWSWQLRLFINRDLRRIVHVKSRALRSQAIPILVDCRWFSSITETRILRVTAPHGTLVLHYPYDYLTFLDVTWSIRRTDRSLDIGLDRLHPLGTQLVLYKQDPTVDTHPVLRLELLGTDEALNASTRARWTATIHLPVQLHDAITDAMRPVQSPSLDQAARAALSPRILTEFTYHAPSRTVLRMSLTRPMVPADLAIAARVTLFQGTRSIASHQVLCLHPDLSLDAGASVSFPIDRSLEELRAGDYSLEIEADETLALRDPLATSYWQGRFTIPVIDILPPEHSANPPPR